MQKDELSNKEKGDIRTLVQFVEIYCRENHDKERSPFSFRLYDLKEILKKRDLCLP